MTDLICELHRLHWRLGLLVILGDVPNAVIRGCADQYNAALDEWLKEREMV